MATWTLTQVGSAVLNTVESVPTNISGALPDLANMSLQKVQNYTGQTIGSNSIAEKYQAAILYLTSASVANQMSLEGADKGYRLGDFSVSAGAASSSTSSVASKFAAMAERELQLLGRSIRYGRTY